MKKIALATIALGVMGVSASAQTAVLKEAERAMKGNQSLNEVVAIITPAFTNPETQSVAQTYYIPGKAAFNDFDKSLVSRQLGQLDQAGINQQVVDLLEGYNYFMKALPLDSFPDEKGKIKPKYAKDIYNVLSGHYMDYNNAAVDAWNAENYKGAYDAWGVILALPNDPNFVKVNPKEHAFADSTLSELAYNQGLAAFQAKMYDEALASFAHAKSLGYNKKSLYDYAVAVAVTGNNHDAVLEWANMAIPLYGKEDDSYIRQIINSQLNDGKVDEAMNSINTAIASDPNNSQYYWVLGIIYNFQKEGVRDAINKDDNATDSDPRYAEIADLHQKAKDAFQKAIELNPENSSAYSSLGLLTYEDAQAVENAGPVGSQSYYDEQVVPVIKKSVEYYEKALSLNPQDETVMRALEGLYYILNDTPNQERIKQMRLDLE